MIITRVFLFNLWSIRPEKIVCPRLIVLGIMQCASIVCNVDTHAMCCKMHMFVPINRLNLAPLFPRSNSTAFQTNLRPMSMHTGTLQVGTENDFLHTSTTSTFWTYACAKWAHSNSLYSYCYYCNSFIIIAACMLWTSQSRMQLIIGLRCSLDNENIATAHWCMAVLIIEMNEHNGRPRVSHMRASLTTRRPSSRMRAVIIITWLI